jgi:hypothetical protein
MPENTMSNPFELSLFVDQHRRRLQAKQESLDNPREAFATWVSVNEGLVGRIVDALSGPGQPNYFLALHEPGNPLPRKFMQVLCEQPEIACYEGTDQSIPGDSVLDSLHRPRPVEALADRWSQSPNAFRFVLNTLAALAQVSESPKSSEQVRDTLTRFESVFPDDVPGKTFRDGKSIQVLAARIAGKREPLEFPNSRLPEEYMLGNEMVKVVSQCDLLCKQTEAAFNIKSRWGTHVLTRMGVWEESSTEGTGMQVRVSHDESRTRDNFDVLRKIVHTQWQAPAHIEERVQQWVTQSQAYDPSMANRLDARRSQQSSPTSSAHRP